MQQILIAEDSPTMRALLVATFEELGPDVKVVVANGGFEALRLLPRHRFDLIVTDVNMPDINGLELVSFVKNNPAHAGIPLMIISSEGSERDLEKGTSLGADAYVVKPFDPEEVRRLARDLLQRRART